MEPSFNEVLAVAVDASKQSDGQTDFLLASLEPRRLITIEAGVVADHDSYCRIGLPEAEHAYLHLESAQPRPDGQPISYQLGEMSRAMARLVEDASVPEVGMFVIPIETTTDGFHYSFYAEIHARSPPPPARTWQAVPLGSIETGTYAFEFVELDKDGIRIPIIRFPQAGFAYAFEDRSLGAPRAMLLAKHGPTRT